MAAVARIRTRIDEQSKKAARPPAAPYKVTIPNTTIDYSMAPVPAGEFLMGAAGSNARPDEQPQHKVRLDPFWMQAHEVTWDAYLMFMFADQAKESTSPDALVDALSRPTAPFVEMSFGRGNNGFPAISMTQHAANKFAEWLSAKTGEFYRLPTEAEWEYACKAGTETGIPSGTLGDYAWFAANSPQAQFTKGTYHGRHEEAQCVGALRHARQRDGVDPGPVRAVHGGRGGKPVGEVTAPYPHAVRGGSWNDEEMRVDVHGHACRRIHRGKNRIRNCRRASGI